MEMLFEAKYKVWHGGKSDGEIEHTFSRYADSLTQFTNMLEEHVGKTEDIVRYLKVENKGHV